MENEGDENFSWKLICHWRPFVTLLSPHRKRVIVCLTSYCSWHLFRHLSTDHNVDLDQEMQFLCDRYPRFHLNLSTSDGERLQIPGSAEQVELRLENTVMSMNGRRTVGTLWLTV